MNDQKRVSTTVPLNWKEVWYTNCPMVSANNVDQELGWCKEEYKKIGVEYAYFRHAPENNWYPHYIHNLDNLIRFGGLYPPIQVNADIRRTVLLGATWVYEGGVMQVRARDKIFRMQDLKSKKIGITKSLNTIKNDWRRISGAYGYTEYPEVARHDDRRYRIGRIPLCGRLVRQARDAGAADEQSIRTLDAARPQARLRLPATGKGITRWHRRCHLQSDGATGSTLGGDRSD